MTVNRTADWHKQWGFEWRQGPRLHISRRWNRICHSYYMLMHTAHVTVTQCIQRWYAMTTWATVWHDINNGTARNRKRFVRRNGNGTAFVHILWIMSIGRYGRWDWSKIGFERENYLVKDCSLRICSKIGNPDQCIMTMMIISDWDWPWDGQSVGEYFMCCQVDSVNRRRWDWIAWLFDVLSIVLSQVGPKKILRQAEWASPLLLSESMIIG